MIAKFRYHSENLAIAKIENFAMIVIFTMIAKTMIAKISLSLRNFRYHCENFAIP